MEDRRTLYSAMIQLVVLNLTRRRRGDLRQGRSSVRIVRRGDSAFCRHRCGPRFLWAGRARRWRRATLRHRVETVHLERWLDLTLKTAPGDRALAAEIVNCRRLIKGYADTRARGGAKFDKVLAALPMLEGRADAADWLRRLREAALRDEGGEALDGGLRTVASFARDAAA